MSEKIEGRKYRLESQNFIFPALLSLVCLFASVGFSVDGGSETWCMKPTPNDKSAQEVVGPSSIPVSRGETKIFFSPI